MFGETKQDKYYVLRAVSATDDTALVLSGTSSTCDFENKPSYAVSVPDRVNAISIIFLGTDAANEVMNWTLYAYKDGGPAEYVAAGTATLGTQPVDSDVAGATGGFYADTITISSQKWLKTVTVVDNGSNRVAKLVFDGCGYKYFACVMSDSTTATHGAYWTYF
jgi:hypothetical protein